MKVKLFINGGPTTVKDTEKEVNNFILGKRVVDIKITMNAYGRTIMVMYEEV